MKEKIERLEKELSLAYTEIFNEMQREIGGAKHQSAKKRAARLHGRLVAMKQYDRINKIESALERSLEVHRIGKMVSFSLEARKLFNDLAWKGKLRVPQVEEW